MACSCSTDDPRDVLKPVKRWTAGRKAAVVLALRQQQVTCAEVIGAHAVSEDELSSCDRRHQVHGQAGLAVQQLQALR